MSYECLALNQSGSCCKNWTQVLEDGSSTFTCYTHRNFFNNHDVLKDRVLRLRGRFLEWADRGLQRRLGICLENNLLRLTLQDFQEVPHHFFPSYNILFLLIARHTDMDLSQNLDIWVPWITWLWNHSWRIAWSPLANPHSISAEDMITVLCRDSIAQYYCGLYRFPDELMSRMPEEDWFKFFNQTLEDPIWAHRFWSSDEHQYVIEYALEKMPRLRNHPLRSILTGERYKTWLQESKKAWYDNQKERIASVKGELVAVTRHPSRMISWTINAEEQIGLTKRWDIVTEPIASLAEVLEEVRSAFTTVCL